MKKNDMDKIVVSEMELKDMICEAVGEVMAQGAGMTDPRKIQGMPFKQQWQKLVALNKTLNLALKQANELGLTDARNHIGLGIAVVESEFAKMKIGQGTQWVKDKVSGMFNGGKQQ